MSKKKKKNTVKKSKVVNEVPEVKEIKKEPFSKKLKSILKKAIIWLIIIAFVGSMFAGIIFAFV